MFAFDLQVGAFSEDTDLRVEHSIRGSEHIFMSRCIHRVYSHTEKVSQQRRCMFESLLFR